MSCSDGNEITQSKTFLWTTRRRLLYGGIGLLAWLRGTPTQAQDLPSCRSVAQTDDWEISVATSQERRSIEFKSLVSKWEMRVSFSFRNFGGDTGAQSAFIFFNPGDDGAVYVEPHIGKVIVRSAVVDGDKEFREFHDITTAHTRAGWSILSSQEADQFFQAFIEGKTLQMFRGVWDGSAYVESHGNETIEITGIQSALAVAADEVSRVQSDLDQGQCKPAKFSCYLTTAACDVVGLSDDCFELRQLRRFRDEWLAKQVGGEQEISAYYHSAPGVLADINRSERREIQLAAIYATAILPASLAAYLGLNRLAYVLYRRMCRRLGVAAALHDC